MIFKFKNFFKKRKNFEIKELLEKEFSIINEKIISLNKMVMINNKNIKSLDENIKKFNINFQGYVEKNINQIKERFYCALNETFDEVKNIHASSNKKNTKMLSDFFDDLFNKISDNYPKDQKIYAEEVNKLNDKIQTFINYEDTLNEFKDWTKSFLINETEDFFKKVISEIKRFDVSSGNLLTHYHVKIDEIAKLLELERRNK